MNQESELFSRRILVVDDNPAIHDDFRKILCPSISASSAKAARLAAEFFDDAPEEQAAIAFEMDSAFQGQEALLKIQAAEAAGRPYSLAFMDVRMPPGWDGVETISQIWRQYPRIQVVICTAYSDYSWGEILGKLGETDSLVILKKPFDNVEVLQLAHTLTKKWSLNRQASLRMADLDGIVQRRTQELTEANLNLQKEIQRRALIEGALRESEERFHKAFEAVPVALAVQPVNTSRYLDVNQSFVNLCGYAKEELLDKPADELRLMPAPEQLMRLVRSLREGKPVRNAALEIRRKDGQFRHTVVSIELVKLGEQICFLAAWEDVTDQKQLEGQLRQAQKMEAVGQLAAGVAHDFNNLLTVIHGYASLQLAKSTLDTDVAKAFTQVKLASERASSLTRQLLAFSRKQVVQRKPLDVAATLSRMQTMLQRLLGESIRLECATEPTLPLINADESNLEQVIMNLAVNARDAMPSGGKLSLSAGTATISADQAAGHPDMHEGTFVVLSVVDTGSGMDPQTLSHIFEPFFTTKPIGRGSGLGLSTVYGIVKQHEGWIEVESQLGIGTTFRVFLPATSALPQPMSPKAEAPPAASTNTPPGSGDAILVVEDEPEVREYVRSVLTSGGYKVALAATGAEALLKWKDLDCKVRLLLTDMEMPGGVNGPALAQHLLRREPALKVVYTSGYCPEAIASGVTLTEGMNFLSKPFVQERLLETVRNALT
jgi:two-component system, cell cycle sensor histidine kinase and response regulator CckA